MPYIYSMLKHDIQLQFCKNCRLAILKALLLFSLLIFTQFRKIFLTMLLSWGIWKITYTYNKLCFLGFPDRTGDQPAHTPEKVLKLLLIMWRSCAVCFIFYRENSLSSHMPSTSRNHSQTSPHQNSTL